MPSRSLIPLLCCGTIALLSAMPFSVRSESRLGTKITTHLEVATDNETSNQAATCDISAQPYTIYYMRALDLERTQSETLSVEFLVTNNTDDTIQSFSGSALISTKGLSRSEGAVAFISIPPGKSKILDVKLILNGDAEATAVFQDASLTQIKYTWTMSKITFLNAGTINCSQ